MPSVSHVKYYMNHMNKKYQQKHKLYKHDVMQMVNAFFLIEIQVRQWYDFFNLQYSNSLKSPGPQLE